MKIRSLSDTNQNETSPDSPLVQSALQPATVFLITTVIIVFFGLILLYSVTYTHFGMSFFIKQLVWMFVGLAGGATAVFLGYKKLCRWSPYMMVGVMLLLIIARLNQPVNGAYRWIRLGPYSIQPSEYAKVVLVLFTSYFLWKRTRLIETDPFKKVILPSAIAVGCLLGLVFLGKDLGTTVLLAGVYMALLFVAGIKLRWILPPIIGGTVGGYYLIKWFSPFRMDRLITFLNPEQFQAKEGYQLWNSLMALGSGAWSGLGLSESRMKQKYLPEAHTDFILSIGGEELGYVTLCCVVLAYVILLISGLAVSARAKDRLGMMTAFGCTVFIAFQAFINIGVICGALPTKGMPAPLISYGGSNLVACLTAVGCVISVAMDNAFPEYSEKRSEQP